MASMSGPRIGGPKDFWKVISSVSIAEISRAAERPLSVALIGPDELRRVATQALYADDAQGKITEGKVRSLPQSPFVQGYDALTEAAGFPQTAGVFDLVIDLGVGREAAPDGLLIYALGDIGGWDATLDRILEDRPDLSLALARNFPVFRRRVANRIILETATANAQFSLITGVTAAFPLLGALLPISALSDILALTKNQAMMTLRLAAAYGLSLDYKSRMKEVAPVLLNAFGWRAVARELIGALPFGGFIAKGVISYAGTVAIGKATQAYYETGEKVTGEQARRYYLEAYAAGKERVKALAANLRKGGGGGGSRQPKRLPAPPADLAEIEAES